MRTNDVVSRSVSVDAVPSAVLEVLGDPQALPRWAPRFAEHARTSAADRWVVGAGGEEFEIRVRAGRHTGTVDFLALDEERGLFARVVSNGEGSAVVLTLVLPAATPADVIEREIGVLERELQAVRALCEA